MSFVSTSSGIYSPHLLDEMNDTVLVVVAHVASVKISLGVQEVFFNVEVSRTHLARFDANLSLEVRSRHRTSSHTVNNL